jgi:hypothetical protein
LRDWVQKLQWWGCEELNHLQYERNPASIVAVVDGREEQ